MNCDGAENSKLNKDICICGLFCVWIQNFNVLSQFGSKMWEGRTQKMSKIVQKTFFWVARGCNMAEKSEPQKNTFKSLTEYIFQISTSYLNSAAICAKVNRKK